MHGLAAHYLNLCQREKVVVIIWYLRLSFFSGLYALVNEAALKGRDLLCLCFVTLLFSIAVLCTFYSKNT